MNNKENTLQDILESVTQEGFDEFCRKMIADQREMANSTVDESLKAAHVRAIDSLEIVLSGLKINRKEK